MNEFINYKFVKNEDLNHHNTLFAGRAAEWFVEAGLLTVGSFIAAENIVCINIHEMRFLKPIQLGDIIQAKGKIVSAGNSSVMVNIEFLVNMEIIVSGYITYVCVDKNGKSFLHGIKIDENDLDAEKIKKVKQFKEML